MQVKTGSLLKGLPREKLEVNPFHVLEIHSPLGLRPHPWANSNFKPKKKSGGGEGRGGGTKRHFKSQAENYEISVGMSGFMYALVCVFFFFFLYDIAEVVDEF